MTHRQLYGLAALLWLIAGVNVLRIGLVNWSSETNILVSILWLIGSLAFFAGFIFPRVVKRNLTALGQRAEGTLRWYQCFTPSSWIIMAGMITLGITLRALDLVPHSFVTGFYTGLGLSLILSTYSVFEDKKAAYYTLGCKLNFAETSTIGRSLLAQGVRSVRPREVADICVINTCSVTELADKKCRTMIRKAAREHPGSFVVVTGCYAQLSPEEIADIEGVHLVIGSEKKLVLRRAHASLPQGAGRV